MTYRFLPAVAFIMVHACAAISTATEYSQLYVFGDSLSETGNVYAATRGLIPSDPPYYQGRFSDGPVWVEHLADHLGISLVANGGDPTMIVGNNFSAGGARVVDDIPVPPLGTIPSLLSQAGYFVQGAVSVPPDALYVVYGGYNDVSTATQVSSSLTDTEQQQLVRSAARGIAATVDTLYAAGARSFLVPNLADFGATPEARIVRGNAELATELTHLFNVTLADALTQLEQTRAIQLHPLDTYALTQELINDAVNNDGALYGITNVESPIFAGYAGSPGHDPATSLFADNLHISAAAHRYFGDAAIRAIPEPSSILTVAWGLFGIIAVGCLRR